MVNSMKDQSAPNVSLFNIHDSKRDEKVINETQEAPKSGLTEIEIATQTVANLQSCIESL